MKQLLNYFLNGLVMALLIVGGSALVIGVGSGVILLFKAFPTPSIVTVSIVGGVWACIVMGKSMKQSYNGDERFFK